MLGQTAVLALLIAWLLPFPGQLFNETVEAHYDEISGWLRRPAPGADDAPAGGNGARNGA